MESWIRSIRSDNFTEEVMLSKGLLLIVCLAQDDGYAGQMKVLQQISRRFGKEINMCLLAQDSMEICRRQLQISGTPTFILMKDGEEISRILGVTDEKTLTMLLDRCLSAQLSENESKTEYWCQGA